MSVRDVNLRSSEAIETLRNQQEETSKPKPRKFSTSS